MDPRPGVSLLDLDQRLLDRPEAVPPLDRAGHRGARQRKGNVMTGTIDKWTARTVGMAR